ncbi:AAA family ATPase [Candidatus Synechococcus spongiarum]|uniref:Overcoming lysogenization defect protein n=1 Tax=Candidatus Synechococcus spongiarum TaxID=431041 RepID=A0A171DHJ2_9SYNE|nr:AAA family ATPase [Candidatus Synechococcus spongiarum]SAY39278.1 Overcoming lysogenization defect protein [Candidatus Synechococcus spongiarum]
MVNRIRARNIGPVREADIHFGDLTVFVGPQATGKSIFLQMLKLLVDKASIHETMRYFGVRQNVDASAFFDLYFGEGMASIWTKGESCLVLDQAQKQKETDLKETDLTDYARDRLGRKKPGREKFPEKMFYIPVQRVMSLRDGMTHPFNDYRAGDPFVLRNFSNKLHLVLQNEIGLGGNVFPRQNRLSAELRKPLEEHIFNKFALRTDTSAHQRRLVLKSSSGRPLPYLVWSAGQREFVPLLLGLYWLLPSAKISCRAASVVIEEPEMGLHPNGISAVLNFVMELRSRGYRVYLSTHSPHVLDIVWALRFFQKNNGQQKDVLKLLGLSSTPKTRQIAAAVLEKKSEFRTYYFARDSKVHDISPLDPGSETLAEGGWGGLTEFSGRVGDVVAEVGNRNEGS